MTPNENSHDLFSSNDFYQISLTGTPIKLELKFQDEANHDLRMDLLKPEIDYETSITYNYTKTIESTPLQGVYLINVRRLRGKNTPLTYQLYLNGRMLCPN